MPAENVLAKKVEYSGMYGYPDLGGYSEPIQDGQPPKPLVDQGVYDGPTDESGLRHGVGKLTFLDGSTYFGEWAAGKKSGKGKWTFPNGTYYDGMWVNDMQHGKGEYKQADGCVIQASWENGRLHGEGVYIGADGKSNKATWNYDLMVPDGEWAEKDSSDNVCLAIFMQILLIGSLGLSLVAP